MNDMARMIIVLTAICLVSAAALTALNEGLAEQIAYQEEINLRGPAVMDIFAGAANNPVEAAFSHKIDGVEWRMYPVIENGACTSVAMQTSGAGGYGGNVMVMTGIDLTNDTITGVRVTLHSETPGIGTRVIDPKYLRVYKGYAVTGGTEIALKANGGEIEAVSGATRTSTAVADGVNKAVNFIMDHKDEIPGWVSN